MSFAHNPSTIGSRFRETTTSQAKMAGVSGFLQHCRKCNQLKPKHGGKTAKRYDQKAGCFHTHFVCKDCL